jgi:MFS transporter, Spinster family, sphingosine-1-phosphate transporter
VYLLVLLAAANLLHYAVRNVAFPMYDALRLRFEASEASLGLVGSAFMVPHAIATVMVGWLGDRMDRRGLMAAGLAVWSVAAAFAAVAQSMEWFLAARALAGLGTAACVPVANALICDAFPPGATARAVSIFNLGLFLGGVVGVVGGEGLGFPIALWVVGVPGVLLAALIAAAPAPPRITLLAGESGRLAPPQALRAMQLDGRAIFAAAPFRWTVAGAVLMAFAAGAYLAWFIDLLHDKGMRGADASTLFAAALAGGLAGVLTGGAVADRLRRTRRDGRQVAVAISFAAAVPFAVLAIELSPGPAFYAACCALMFFISWYHAPLAASVDELAPAGREATAQGLYIFCMHLLGTAPASYLVGLVKGEVGLAAALYLPTAAMALAALAFAAAARSVRRAGLVLKRQT